MAELMRRDARTARTARALDVVGPLDLFGSIDRAFERMFDVWPGRRLGWPLPVRRPLLDEYIPVDEYWEAGALVVRAELPGIDPDKDVELTVTEGVLRIKAERHEEEHKEGTGYVRQELHYGCFTRTLPLPDGVTEADIKASYKDGILEVRVPSPTPVAATKIPIGKG
jgi:HSP20 family protein